MKTWVAVLALAIAALVVTMSRAASPPQPGAGDWTQFRFYSDNNAVVSGATVARWHVVTGGGGTISASPTLSGSTIFVGNNKGYMTAIDVNTGAVVWSHHVTNPLMTAPLIYGNTIISGEGNEDSPASGQLYVGSGHNALIAFNKATGDIAWQTALAGSGMPTPAIAGGLLIHHNGAGYVTAFDPTNGQQKYAQNVRSVASMSAMLPIGDAVATVGVQDNAAFLLRAADGKVLWRSAFSGAASGLGDCPQVTDGNAIYCNYLMPSRKFDTYVTIGGTALQHAYALDARSGAKLWDIRLEGGTVPMRNEAAIPLLNNGVLYFGSAIAPFVHAIDAKSGRVLWTRKVHGPVKGGLVTVDGAVFFGDFAGYLWALDGRSGATIGSKKMGSGFNVGSPLLVGRTLIQGSRVGTVYAVPIDDIRNARDS